MNELRWILLTLGVLLIVGLYLWGMRARTRSGIAADAARRPAVFTGTADSFETEQDPLDEAPLPAAARRIEPSLSHDAAANRAARGFERAAGPRDAPDPAGTSSRREPTWSARRDTTEPPGGGRASGRRIEPSLGSAADARREADFEPAWDDASARETKAAVEFEDVQHVEPAPGIEPPRGVEPRHDVERQETRQARDPDPAAAPAAEAKPARPQQKIIAMRVNAVPPARLEGALLRDAILAEGLEFGRYDIFHRLHTDGRPVFSVASLREPGTFDLQAMPTSVYPGVALFAVLPGPMSAAETLDDMIFTARALAAQLGGALADERGAPLTPLRVGRLREDALEFERSSGPA